MQVSDLRGKEAVCSHRCASPHYVIVSHLVGQLDPGHLWLWQLGSPPLVPSGCGRGLSGQGVCLPLSLLVDYMEVSGCVEMVGSVVHAHPRLPSSCWAHLFCPQLTKYMESSLNYNHHYLPVQRIFVLTLNL
jgi:hypothetical protein